MAGTVYVIDHGGRRTRTVHALYVIHDRDFFTVSFAMSNGIKFLPHPFRLLSAPNLPAPKKFYLST